MVLHLVPDGFDQVELEEIRLFPDDPQPKTPMMHEWTSDNKEQTIIHPSIDRQPVPRYPIATSPGQWVHPSVRALLRDSGQVRWHERQCATPGPGSHSAAGTRRAAVDFDLHL
jgi:hypothetical protein